jgi:hypothetical protein
MISEPIDMRSSTKPSKVLLGDFRTGVIRSSAVN